MLVEATRGVVSALSLHEVLERVVAAARDIIGADYAALAVIGRGGLLEQFVHVGMDPPRLKLTSLSVEGSGEPTHAPSRDR